MPPPFDGRVARQVAHAAGSFEHVLLGRVPASVTVASADDWLVLHLHEPFSQVERTLSRDPAGRRRVEAFHQAMFDQALDALVGHVWKASGVDLRGGLVHVDVGTGSVIKTLATHPGVDLFLLGPALPPLGVPVDAHRHAQGSRTTGDVARGGHFREGPTAMKG